MPIYVYQCNQCQKEFEVFQSIKAKPLTKCDCNGEVRRVIQPCIGFVDKGITTVGKLAEVQTKQMGSKVIEKQQELKKQQEEAREKGRQELEKKYGHKVIRPTSNSSIPELPQEVKKAVDTGDQKRINKYLYEGK